MVNQPFHKSRVFSVELETVDKSAIADLEGCARQTENQGNGTSNQSVKPPIICNSLQESEDDCLTRCLEKKFLDKFGCMHSR